MRLRLLYAQQQRRSEAGRPEWWQRQLCCISQEVVERGKGVTANPYRQAVAGSGGNRCARCSIHRFMSSGECFANRRCRVCGTQVHAEAKRALMRAARLRAARTMPTVGGYRTARENQSASCPTPPFTTHLCSIGSDMLPGGGSGHNAGIVEGRRSAAGAAARIRRGTAGVKVGLAVGRARVKPEGEKAQQRRVACARGALRAAAARAASRAARCGARRCACGATRKQAQPLTAVMVTR